MADDDRRVESRITMVGAGLGTTPERIDDIQTRQAQMERASRPPPTKSFEEVFAATLEAADLAGAEEEDDTPMRPSKGRANMTTYQRSLMGLDDDAAAEDKILIKG